MGKGGSSTLFNWVWIGASGNSSGWANTVCGTFSQNINAACWRRDAVALVNLSTSEMHHVVYGATTLRVAVQREPMARLKCTVASGFG